MTVPMEYTANVRLFAKVCIFSPERYGKREIHATCNIVSKLCVESHLLRLAYTSLRGGEFLNNWGFYGETQQFQPGASPTLAQRGSILARNRSKTRL